MSQECPLCGAYLTAGAVLRRACPHTSIPINCAVCGQFGIVERFTLDPSILGGPRPYLSAATRKASERDDPLCVDLDNWRKLEEEQRSIKVSTKLTDLLRLIAKRSPTVGEKWKYKLETDYPLIAAANASE